VEVGGMKLIAHLPSSAEVNSALIHPLNVFDMWYIINKFV